MEKLAYASLAINILAVVFVPIINRYFENSIFTKSKENTLRNKFYDDFIEASSEYMANATLFHKSILDMPTQNPAELKSYITNEEYNKKFYMYLKSSYKVNMLISGNLEHNKENTTSLIKAQEELEKQMYKQFGEEFFTHMSDYKNKCSIYAAEELSMIKRNLELNHTNFKIKV